jgi:hypothetical protein
VERGYINISDTNFTYTQANVTSNRAWYGDDDNALGKADGTHISLGDGGFAILTFDLPISNGVGADFAVFENAIFAPPNQDTILFAELAFVEVSSDSVNFFRFPAISHLQYETQIGTFGNVDYRLFENFAGQYPTFWGTPFDLDDIEDDELLNKQHITHIKIIDVVGVIDSEFSSYDTLGNIVNDPFPTPFWIGGFDLDAVGVIHQQQMSVNQELNNNISVYPNPAQNDIYISGINSDFNIKEIYKVEIYDISGHLIRRSTLDTDVSVDISDLKSGIYSLNILCDTINIVCKFVVMR